MGSKRPRKSIGGAPRALPRSSSGSQASSRRFASTTRALVSRVPPSRGRSEASCSSLERQRVETDPAAAAVSPPWSVPLKATVRHQPTTLEFHVQKLSPALLSAQGCIGMRQYQPMSAEHGLEWRLARHGEEMPRLRSASVMSAAASESAPRGMQKPTWWGLGPAGSDNVRPSYEDIGESPRSRLGKASTTQGRSRSVPSLSKSYVHKNPFIAQFERRLPGGIIVCDTSVCRKPCDKEGSPWKPGPATWAA